MLEQLTILLSFYGNPRQAASQALDAGRLGIAIVIALLAALAIQMPSMAARQRLVQEMNILREAVSESDLNPEQRSAAARQIGVVAGYLRSRQTQGIGFQPEQALTELLVTLGVFVPLGIAVLAAWQGSGRMMAAVEREFGPVVLCMSFAWAAAHLPFIPVLLLAPNALGSAVGWLWVIASLYFLVLAAACFRTALGVDWIPAGVTACLGALIFFAAHNLPINLSPMLYLFASPWLLYFFWGRISSGAASIGSSVSGRQAFRRAIEATTINPRDADAHYQLGLIQVQRRNWTAAESRFRTAAGIDPGDADYCFQLGRALRQQSRDKEALEWLVRAAQLNDKTSSSEVWREIGGARLALQDWPASVTALERYVARREYDPIGLVYLGEALSQLGRLEEARQLFERAIEAVRTMPSHRRGELRGWSGRASQGLRRLKLASTP